MEETTNSVTSFKVAGEYFAFDTKAISHILENQKPTIVPLTKAFIKGIINNHGNMIPVVDFRMLIGKEPDDTLAESCIIVVQAGQGAQAAFVGFKVDEVDEVFEYEAADYTKDVVIEIDRAIQNTLSGTIKHNDKFIYTLKIDELAKAIE